MYNIQLLFMKIQYYTLKYQLNHKIVKKNWMNKHFLLYINDELTCIIEIDICITLYK